LPQAGEAPQRAVLHLLEGTGVGWVLVYRDGAWVHRVPLPECLAEELLCSLGVALGREQEVNRLAAAVDRTVPVHPAALHPDVGLVDPPRAVVRPEMRPGRFSISGL
jgi:hypothetical protein